VELYTPHPRREMHTARWRVRDCDFLRDIEKRRRRQIGGALAPREWRFEFVVNKRLRLFGNAMEMDRVEQCGIIALTSARDRFVDAVFRSMIRIAAAISMSVRLRLSCPGRDGVVDASKAMCARFKRRCAGKSRLAVWRKTVLCPGQCRRNFQARAGICARI